MEAYIRLDWKCPKKIASSRHLRCLRPPVVFFRVTHYDSLGVAYMTTYWTPVEHPEGDVVVGISAEEAQVVSVHPG